MMKRNRYRVYIDGEEGLEWAYLKQARRYVENVLLPYYRVFEKREPKIEIKEVFYE